MLGCSLFSQCNIVEVDPLLTQSSSCRIEMIMQPKVIMAKGEAFPGCREEMGFGEGEGIGMAAEEAVLHVQLVFETGSAKCYWLNDVVGR